MQSTAFKKGNSIQRVSESIESKPTTVGYVKEKDTHGAKTILTDTDEESLERISNTYCGNSYPAVFPWNLRKYWKNPKYETAALYGGTIIMDGFAPTPVWYDTETNMFVIEEDNESEDDIDDVVFSGTIGVAGSSVKDRTPIWYSKSTNMFVIGYPNEVATSEVRLASTNCDDAKL